jgi:hypothetical protein
LKLSSTTTKEAALYGDSSSDQVKGYEICDILVALFPLLGKMDQHTRQKWLAVKTSGAVSQSSFFLQLHQQEMSSTRIT